MTQITGSSLRIIREICAIGSEDNPSPEIFLIGEMKDLRDLRAYTPFKSSHLYNFIT